ncbi:MAG: hypothetical protein M3N39_05555 [Pseudomonadota bacterium]|nr:hypothetical protein [Pseudomonadota bacterium]
MAKHALKGTGANWLRADDLQLVLETLSWFAAWLIVPAWLGFRDVGGSAFLLFSLGAGLLLSIGVAADRPRAFEQLGDVAWFAGVSSLAVTVIGGTVFGLASILRAHIL